MGYSIGQVSKILNIQPSTIRFYDNEGLIPLVKRNESGIREFNDSNIGMLRTINCLRNTGMPIKQIKKYSDLVLGGSSTNQERYELILDHKKKVEEHIEELKKNLELIEHKCLYYKKEIKKNTDY